MRQRTERGGGQDPGAHRQRRDPDRFIIAQPTAGNFVAYSAVCPHQGSKITQVLDDGSVRCPSHGSVFDLETGAALAGPADKPLTTATLTEEGDTLTVAP